MDIKFGNVVIELLIENCDKVCSDSKLFRELNHENNLNRYLEQNPKTVI